MFQGMGCLVLQNKEIYVFFFFLVLNIGTSEQIVEQGPADTWY